MNTAQLPTEAELTAITERHGANAAIAAMEGRWIDPDAQRITAVVHAQAEAFERRSRGRAEGWPSADASQHREARYLVAERESNALVARGDYLGAARVLLDAIAAGARPPEPAGLLSVLAVDDTFAPKDLQAWPRPVLGYEPTGLASALRSEVVEYRGPVEPTIELGDASEHEQPTPPATEPAPRGRWLRLAVASLLIGILAVFAVAELGFMAALGRACFVALLWFAAVGVSTTLADVGGKS